MSTPDYFAAELYADAETWDWQDRGLRSHQRIAARLAQYAEGRALYVDGSGWHHWDGTRWARDARDASVYAMLSQLLKLCWSEAMGDADLTADVRASMSASGTAGVLELASRSPRLFATQVDTDPWLLNCQNGTLDLHTLKLRPHDPADRITRITAAAFDADAESQTWDTFLESSLPDPDVRAFLQRYAGLALIGRVIEHVMVIATGTGRNGKGIFARSVSKALGDYAVTATNDLLVTGRHGGKTAGELAAQMVLRGARWAVMSELDKNDRMNEALLKSLTGGDQITAKLMGQNFVTFDPSHSFLLQTNDLPSMDADAAAAWARVRVVPFDVSFIGREDNTLEERLEAELSAVLTWAVAGLRDYQARGNSLAEPEAVSASTTAYQAENDPLSRFISDCCILHPAASVSTGALADRYTEWAAQSGEPPMTSRTIGKHIKSMPGITATRSGQARGFMGIGVRADEAR